VARAAVSAEIPSSRISTRPRAAGILRSIAVSLLDGG
jgi:hypothetical protein